MTRRKAFIRALAEFLSGDQARKSIELQMGKESAQQWAALRRATPLFGYPTVDETEKTLTQFLDADSAAPTNPAASRTGTPPGKAPMAALPVRMGSGQAAGTVEREDGSPKGDS